MPRPPVPSSVGAAPARPTPNGTAPESAAAWAAPLFAEVAAQGGAARVLQCVAQEVARVASGEAAVLRLDGSRCAAVAAWPPHVLAAGSSVLGGEDWQVHLSGGTCARTVGSYLAAPVVVEGVCWGAVVARNARSDVGDLLELFAGLVALGAANVACVGDAGIARAPAEVDPLTGVASHRAFRKRLAVEYRHAEVTGADLSLVLIDIDRFKGINDLHGHLAGDEVLRDFARMLAGCARTSDLVARTGGGEFAWIMPGADAKNAWDATERFRAQVAARRVGPADGVTLSAGICTAGQAGDLDELVRFAEGALYWAKDRGRDATYVFTPEVVRVLSEEERTRQLSRAHAMRSIRVLARAVDAKDHSTREHSERVADLAVQIAIALGWSMERTADLRDAGLLHDVGKIGIPDAVLLKPGALTDAEYDLVKSHPELGARIASDVLSEEQQAWVRGHHERFDGRGYPDRLAGDAIPEGARILALADSWDVMTSVRSYRETWSMEEALLDCRAEAGHQFWPEAVAALEMLHEAGALLVQSRDETAAVDARPARTTEVT